MTQKTWQFELEDGKHNVELDHGFFSGKRNIRVDGNTILTSSELRHLVLDTGGMYEFNINSHPCAVIIRTNGLSFSYDLAVDGRSTTTGQPIDPIKPLPAWVWLLFAGSASLCVVAAIVDILL
jgi:hypothetical protein